MNPNNTTNRWWIAVEGPAIRGLLVFGDEAVTGESAARAAFAVLKAAQGTRLILGFDAKDIEMHGTWTTDGLPPAEVRIEVLV